MTAHRKRSEVQKSQRTALLLVGVGALMAAGCRLDGEQKKSERSTAPVATASTPEVTPAAQVGAGAYDFTTGTPDGRLATVAYVDHSVYDNVDRGTLRPETAAYFGLASNTDVTWLHQGQTPWIDSTHLPRDYTDVALTFTDIEEAVPRADVVATVVKTCAQVMPGSTLRSCMQALAGKSGAIFFQPKPGTALAEANDNDKNIVLNYFNNAYGVIPTSDGKYSPACVSCHSSYASYQKNTGGVRLVINTKGQASPPDPVYKVDSVALYNAWDSLVQSPNDAFWTSSGTNTLKRYGFVAAQYRKYMSDNATTWHMTQAEREDALKNGSVDDGYKSGWVAAYLSIATANKSYTGMTTAACSDTGDTCFSDLTMRTISESFLPGGARNGIANTALASSPMNTPKKNMRPNQYTLSSTHSPAQMLFSLQYVGANQGSSSVDLAQAAVGYLAGATAFSLPFPNNFDSTLRASWFPGENDATAKANTYSLLKRTITEHDSGSTFNVDARNYFAMRYAVSTPFPASFAPVLPWNATDPTTRGQRASQFVAESCMASCHVNQQIRIDTNARYPLAAGGTPVNVLGNLGGSCGANCAPNWSSFPSDSSTPILFPFALTNQQQYHVQDANGYFTGATNPVPTFTTATTNFANGLASQISTVSQVFVLSADGPYANFAINQSVAHDPSRTALYRWEGNTPVGYESFNEFLKETPHGNRWGILSPYYGPAGSPIAVLPNTYNLDVNGDGTVSATEPYWCDEGRTFTVGGTSYSCHDFLALFGKPRKLGFPTVGTSIHASILRPKAWLTSHGVPSPSDAQVAQLRDDAATWLYALRVGEIILQNPANSAQYLYVQFSPQTNTGGSYP